MDIDKTDPSNPSGYGAVRPGQPPRMPPTAQPPELTLIFSDLEAILQALWSFTPPISASLSPASHQALIQKIDSFIKQTTSAKRYIIRADEP